MTMRVIGEMRTRSIKQEDTKTEEGRSVPLNPLLTKMHSETKVEYLTREFVFTRNGAYISPLGLIEEGFRKTAG